jgi:hypothetical protein
MQPLTCPELYQLDLNESKAEKFWSKIPLLGWWIASSMWAKRARPVEQEIEKQLLSRPETNPALWGDNPRRVKLGQYISKIVKQEMGWPNDHFIPEDVFEIVFWSHHDALDIDEAILNVEDHLNIKIQENDVQRWVGKTLGELVDDLLVKQDSQTA